MLSQVEVVYSGSPEKEDTQYLFFSIADETDRYVIGGAGTDYGQTEQATRSIVSGLEEEKETAWKGTVAAAARLTALTGGLSLSGGTGGGTKIKSGGQSIIINFHQNTLVCHRPPRSD